MLTNTIMKGLFPLHGRCIPRILDSANLQDICKSVVFVLELRHSTERQSTPHSINVCSCLGVILLRMVSPKLALHSGNGLDSNSFEPDIIGASLAKLLLALCSERMVDQHLICERDIRAKSKRKGREK